VYGESDGVEGNVDHRINESLPGMNCGCEPRDIFNADESALSCIADVTEKLKLPVIGKFEKPRC
jgi:hypothetical protein